MLLVQHYRPIASAETEDHRLRRIMLIGLRVSFSRRNVWPDQSRLTPVIVSPKIAPEVYSAIMTIPLLEQ